MEACPALNLSAWSTGLVGCGTEDASEALTLQETVAQELLWKHLVWLLWCRGLCRIPRRQKTDPSLLLISDILYNKYLTRFNCITILEENPSG